MNSLNEWRTGENLDCKSLIREFQNYEREFNGRTAEEFDFFTEHKHWPEQLALSSSEGNC